MKVEYWRNWLINNLLFWLFKDGLIYANNVEHWPRQNNMTTWVGSICMRTMDSQTHFVELFLSSLCNKSLILSIHFLIFPSAHTFWNLCLSYYAWPLICFAFSIVDCWFFLPVISETKNQWARDDPAFVVILILFLVFATSAYCAA